LMLTLRYRLAAFIVLLLVIIAMVAVPATTPDEQGHSPESWMYADLRVFDQPDHIDPALDIISVYTRKNGHTLQIRVDFLDYSLDIEHDLYIALDTMPGGRNDLPLTGQEIPHNPYATELDWNYLVKIAGESAHRIYRTDLSELSGTRLRTYRDYTLDILVISLDASALAGSLNQLTFQIFTTPRGSDQVVDQTPIVHLTASPPPRLSILFAIWDVFPAITPAQALRRWDGAHTGPLGERHGLRHLISAARRTQTPILLLDVLSPTSLSALDYIEAAPALHNLLHTNGFNPAITLLPELTGAHTETSLQRMLHDSYTASQKFLLPASAVLYAPAPVPVRSLPASIKVVVAPDNSQPQSILPEVPVSYLGTKIVAHIQPVMPDQAQRDGPTLALRRELVQAALQLNSRTVHLLGGSLPHSMWGDLNAAYDTLAYLQSRPWLHFLDMHTLMTLQPNHVNLPTGLIQTPPGENAVSGLLSGELAWQTYLALNTPPSHLHPDVVSRRSASMWWIKILDDVHKWSVAPLHEQACQANPAYPERQLCQLANEWLYATFDVDIFGRSAGLIGLFAKQQCTTTVDCGYTQIIGPTFQLAPDLSDPAMWAADAGLWSDPQAIPGAFNIQGSPENPIEILWLPDGLSLTGDYDLTFRLANDRLIVNAHFPTEYLSERAYRTIIPLILAPETRFTPDWRQRYLSTAELHFASWGLVQRPSVEISTTARINLGSFTDSPAPFAHPENPDYEYPPGHFLPFPLAIVELSASSDFELKLSINPGGHE
jgi:hypothetical protein